MQRSLHSQHSAPEMLCPHFPPVYLPVLLNHSLSLSFQKILPFVRSVTDHSAFAAADPDFVHLAMYLFPTAQAVNPFYHRQNLLPGSPKLPAPAVPPCVFTLVKCCPHRIPAVLDLHGIYEFIRIITDDGDTGIFGPRVDLDPK